MRTVLMTLLAAVVASLVDLAIGAAAPRFTQVPRNFPPFTWLPILSGTVGGAVLAAVAYATLHRVSKHPDRLFFFVAIGSLALSFGLPLRLSFTKSVRFAGVTPAAQMVLVLMHAVVATVSVVMLIAKPSR